MKFSTVTWNSIKKFVFGDFNIHHKDWLIHSSGSDRPSELCYIFFHLRWSYSDGYLPYSDSWQWISQLCSFGFVLSSDTSIFSSVAFPQSGNSDHVVVLVSTDFLSNSKWDALFHHSLQLLSGGLQQSLWSFETCSMGQYI